MSRNSKYIYKNQHLQKNSINFTMDQNQTKFSSITAFNSGTFKHILKPKFLNNLKLQNSTIQKKSKYKWENQNNLIHTPSPSQSMLKNSDLISLSKLNKELFNIRKVPLSNIIENFINNHFHSSLPFYSSISKGWFSRSPCDITCMNSKLLNLQSCCFISERYLPRNTLNIDRLFDKINYDITNSTKTENKNSFVQLSQHKLIRKQERNDLSKSLKLSADSSVVFCTNRKLIRESKDTSNKNLVTVSKMFTNCTIPENNSLIKSSSSSKPFLLINKKKHSNLSPILVLTKSKLVRKQNINSNSVSSKNKKFMKSTIVDEFSNCKKLPETLVRVNRNKLIRSSLFQKNMESKQSKSFATNSVLHRMIQYRRRPYPGSSYILLSRNKLVKKAKFKNKTWKKQTDSKDTKEVAKKSNLCLKNFVSLGNNKLIRKSLFTKTNKINYSKNANQIMSPLRKKFFIRTLKSSSGRIQRFTNHLSRINLKYLSNLPAYANYKKFTSTCKNNRKIIRKKKNNFICPVFRRRGECPKYNNSTCSFVHDKKYIILCQRYIKNNCEDESCLLSHELIPEKMPVCFHFLQNRCEFESCPYLHVKPDIHAEICTKFLRGYCEAADKCINWHVYACPDYKNSSKCVKGNKCHLPHRSLEYFEGKLDTSDEDKDMTWRYFEKNKVDEKDLSSVSIIPERHILGVLPDYIPF